MARTKTRPDRLRPMPPPLVGTEFGMVHFAPAREVLSWLHAQILTEGGPLHNPEHAHLIDANLQVLWAAEGFASKGRQVAGQAEEVTFRCNAWQRGRQEQQMREWFGRVPDWLITLDASYCSTCGDAEFCALLEHELYHVGHARDEFGNLAFTKEGAPKLFLRGHDVEEFVGVVRRYGVGHPKGALAQLVRAAGERPEVNLANIAGACGTCLLKAA